MTETSAPADGIPGDAPAPRARRTPRALILGVIVAGVVGAGLWATAHPTPPELQGMVDAREIRIASKVTGRIASFAVEEGQAVRAGQLLYTIDSPEVNARNIQAQGVLQAARAGESKARQGARPEEIDAARAQWRRAQAAADLAQLTFTRTDRLAAQGVVAGQRRDEAQANAVAAAEAARAARAQYDQTLSGARSQDKQAAGGQVEQARGVVDEARAAAAETRMRAPMNGEVGKRLAEPGELVPQGFPVFTLTDVDHPWVSLFVREDAFGGVPLGTIVTGRVPALRNAVARFRLVYIAPAGEFATWRATRQSNGFDIKSFELRVRPVTPLAQLRPGMTVLFDWPR
ncbi:HlyD family secretion protein [Sphingomonas hengshuiensis]|uniref:Hemolysin secretion protein D n=1 Tax=Sphingomonas hengshuiensis TaxID=1609977 RepID=A0A7U4JBE9_9SPHN|nr:efflux RND transporter periplasmic adaptor subunit [Sphingomonas hengshuiensis]AJP73735.1 hemolysin secretion protein D [Sphingomonas hengshuiensis]